MFVASFHQQAVWQPCELLYTCYLLTYHVHGRQHASRALQSDVWNRFVAGRAARSVVDQAGDGRPTSVILLYLNELD